MIQKISLELAEIIGLLCSEGSHIISYNSYFYTSRGKIYRRNNKRSERIEFYNKDIKLIEHYQKLLFREFNHISKVTKHGKINIGKRKIITKIIEITPLGHLKWRVPNVISRSNDLIKIAFLRGYFDGDGTASSRVRMFSTNILGLEQVSKLLHDLNFKHTLQGPILKENRKPAYIIQISLKDEKRFLDTLRPISKIKKNSNI